MSKNTTMETINNAKFDFSAPATVSTETRGKLGDISVWKRSWIDEKGESHELELTDKALVLSASRLDTLLAMREFSSLGVCYELSVLARDKAKFGFKSVGEIGAKLFGLKSATANQYARVGRLFVNMSEGGNGIRYELKPEYKGASVANLVQILSLVDEKADEPTENILNAIANGDLHLNGTLANVKKEVKAIQTGTEIDDDGNVIVDTTAKDVSSIKGNVSEAISVLLAECEHLTDEKKENALVHITALQEIFTNLEVTTD